MTAIFVALILMLQGVAVQQGGTVTGVLRDSQGMPAAGVRVTAVAQPDIIEAAADGTAMAALAETDEQGRFTLADIPPGRYAIAAGRLDLQTYYPGTQDLAMATVVTIAPGSMVTGIDFTLSDTSFGRAPGGLTQTISAIIPVEVAVENGGKLPVTAGRGHTTIVLQSPGTNPIRVPIDGSLISVPGPLTAVFRVVIENLPDTYEVKTIAYGSTDVTRGSFQLIPTNFPGSRSVGRFTFSIPPGPPAQGTSSDFEAALRAYFAARAASVGPSAPSTAYTPPSKLSVTLGLAVPASEDGVRVSGRTGSTSKQLVYISGRPGVFFSDGTFEFYGVTPGRHLIAAAGIAGTPKAAVVVIGDKDVGGIELKETLLLPQDITTPKDPLPIGDGTPGSTVPLPRVSGTVLEEATRTPIAEGEVVIQSGTSSRTVPIAPDGHFETFYLLPGIYDVRLQVFGHSTSARTVIVEDKDLTLELTTRRLY